MLKNILHKGDLFINTASSNGGKEISFKDVEIIAICLDEGIERKDIDGREHISYMVHYIKSPLDFKNEYNLSRYSDRYTKIISRVTKNIKEDNV